MKKIIVIIAILTTTALAKADCIYNGASYPTGTNIGGLICQADGTWK
jgi:hypothetical protein